MRTIQEQVIAEVNGCASDEELMGERTSLDGKTGGRMGVDVIHMAQHYLYHLAQMTYLRVSGSATASGRRRWMRGSTRRM